MRVVIFFTLMLNVCICHAQKKSPMQLANEGKEEKEFSLDCAISNEFPPKNITIDGDDFVIYEAGTNTSLFINDPNIDSKKNYIYEAPYKLIGVRSKAGSKIVYLTLAPTCISKTKLVSAFKGHRINVFTNPSNINAACIIGYAIKYTGSQDYEINCAAGKSMTDTIYPELIFPNAASATEALEDLKNGLSSIQFSYAVPSVQSQKAGINTTTKNIIKSNAYRDFFSPVMNNLVTVFQSRIATAELVQELNTDAFIQGKSDFLEKLFWDKWKDMFESKATIITFEEIANGAGAAQHLVDFEKDKRYATDEIRHIAYDAEHLTNSEWCKKYKDKFKHDVEQMRKSNFSASGGFTYKKLIGLNGNHARGKENKIIDQFEKLIDTEDCGKQTFKESFHYEFDGVKYVPKGIIANEFSKSFSQASATFTFNGRYYGYEINPKIFDLKYSH